MREFRTCPSPVSRQRWSPSLWAARCACGTIVSTSERPSTSSALQPKVVSACGFHPMIRPSVSMLTTASSAESTMSRRCSWASWSRRSASFRAVMSSWNPCQYGGRSSGRTSLASSRIQTTRPSFRTIRYSSENTSEPSVLLAASAANTRSRSSGCTSRSPERRGPPRPSARRVRRSAPRRPGPTYVVTASIGIVEVELLDVEDGRILLDHRPERELGFAEPFLGVPARAHIGQEAEEVVEVPVVVQNGGGDVVHPHPMAVGVAHPILVVERVRSRRC